MKRKFQKLEFYTLKFIIGLLVYFDGRLYMKYYNKLLKHSGIKINGIPRFIAKSVRFDDHSRITLGDRLVVSMNVHFLTHDYSYTTSLIAIGEMPITDIGILRDIKVGSNVFIGMNSLILPGTEIGDNVIVGAGSVVRGKIQNNSVVSGNPAKFVCSIDEYALKVKDRMGQDLIIDKK